MRPCQETERLMRQVLQAYATLPFHGPPLVIPGGIVVTDDVWRCKLEDELDELWESGPEGLENFSLEAWLTAKVAADGTLAQKGELAKLTARLDEVDGGYGPEIIDDGFHYNGLPADIMSIVHQPLSEVEVYRDLSDIAVDADPAPEADDDDDDAQEG